MSPSCEAPNQWFSPSRKLQKKKKNWTGEIVVEKFLVTVIWNVVLWFVCLGVGWSTEAFSSSMAYRGEDGLVVKTLPPNLEVTGSSSVDLRYTTCVRVCLCAYLNQQNKNKTNIKYKNKQKTLRSLNFRAFQSSDIWNFLQQEATSR